MGWKRINLRDEQTNNSKPGRRWELSPILEIDAFNLNVAILNPDERLSENHYHYHENQKELIHVVEGKCQVEVEDDQLVITTDDVIMFETGSKGTHLVHNPFSDPAKVIAIGWPPEGRYPVEKVAKKSEILGKSNE
ncbi:cupin domain-containing protein [Salinarchaeum sp. IM2453]|uniref:cupin domain-containing protein n=1 Tax=Salinarchaeum sp. IM2453 TaxID=2862870 RepID=UPI001C8373B3|nr:cupin domain-containing protein [Salinarchaeum sp. IM2453]QZA88556.1 cupin domain-containing protein [Salinarchaeum sp. IM2453]